jgi:hypothetical protein
MFPPPGTVFDPDALAVLTAAYEKAVRGQAGSLHETIAKRIIQLASEGERDPDRLCHGALAPRGAANLSAVIAPSQCTDNAPWLRTLAGKVSLLGGTIPIPYLVVGLPILVVGWLLSPNANSLHRLYRDRLSKAFLFDPSLRVTHDWLQRREIHPEADARGYPRQLRPDQTALRAFG